MPDAKTLWVWRERLKKQDLIGHISEAVGRQLSMAGFIARGGRIIDANIVTAPIQRNRREENEAIGRGDVSVDWNEFKRAQKDVGSTPSKRAGRRSSVSRTTANREPPKGLLEGRQRPVTR